MPSKHAPTVVEQHLDPAHFVSTPPTVNLPRFSASVIFGLALREPTGMIDELSKETVTEN
ncbi:hypothetical protein N7522_001912 [Penicillium canescens]|nr:hypothetical protein N7522_001912 [Penicillium canescens]KAJ6066190.1 hypothetical protein N7444_000319 [Penicillium canescens]KAJ6066194.1 hypothetical protein N7444_000186 [Penicillium canescens]KAJ6174614.1 hypothetical protein N7485_005351 [Penicillium canescens]KAJ6175273.1 hypothetical protein N7485_005078 [Penicillium canescens]